MQTTTIRVRKSTVFLLVIMILGMIFVSGVAKSYMQYANEQEAAAAEDIDYTGMELIQLAPPDENLPKAVISTTAGDITMVLYQSEAPEAVRRFKAEAESGTYSGMRAGLYDLKSIFTIDSPSQEPYEAELSINLWPFRGAVCMTEKGDIVFINGTPLTDSEKEYLRSDKSEIKEVSKAFADIGGVPNYSRVYAVFGQVTEGIEIVEKIATSGDTVVTIESVTING